jgi:hypothetical protein
VSCAASADSDGDGRGDPCDCAPQDGSAFALPLEVTGLRWAGAGALAWDAQNGAACDVTSGTFASFASFTPGDVCLGDGLTVPSVADTTPPLLPGEGRYFLVRAANVCGVSRWETSSQGRDRPSACP